MREPEATMVRAVPGGPREAQDVPAGYKRTEVGVIPEDWCVSTIRDLFDYQRTANNSRDDLDNSGAVAYVHYGDIHIRFHHFIDFAREDVPRLFLSTAARFQTKGRSKSRPPAGVLRRTEGLREALRRPASGNAARA